MTDTTENSGTTENTETPENEAPEAAAPEIDLAEALLAKDQEIADLKDRVLRTMADMENTRRRLERDKAEATQYAVTGFARDMLAVAENLRRAVASSASCWRSLAARAYPRSRSRRANRLIPIAIRRCWRWKATWTPAAWWPNWPVAGRSAIACCARRW
jgi:hypothetical protein